MTAQDRATDSFRRLIEKGRRIASTCGRDGDNYQRFPAANDYFRFRTDAMNLIRGRAAETAVYLSYAQTNPTENTHG